MHGNPSLGLTGTLKTPETMLTRICRYLCKRRAPGNPIPRPPPLICHARAEIDGNQPAVLATPELSLKAIYSRSLASAKSLSENLDNVELYSEDAGEGKSYADLLKRDDTNAVIIAYDSPVLRFRRNADRYSRTAFLSPTSPPTSNRPSPPVSTCWPRSPWPKTSPQPSSCSSGTGHTSTRRT